MLLVRGKGDKRRLVPSGRRWRLPIPAERPPWLFHSVRNEGFDASDHPLKSISPQYSS